MECDLARSLEVRRVSLDELVWRNVLNSSCSGHGWMWLWLMRSHTQRHREKIGFRLCRALYLSVPLTTQKNRVSKSLIRVFVETFNPAQHSFLAGLLLNEFKPIAHFPILYKTLPPFD